MACALLELSHKLNSYVATKNSAHESIAGRVQKASGEHSIVSAAVRHGDPSRGHIVQDG